MSLSDSILKMSEYEQIDVVRKYHKYAELKKQLLKNQQQYLHSLNMSLYSNLEQYEKLQILTISESKAAKAKVRFYLNFYAYKMAIPEDLHDKFYLLFIRILDQKLRENPKQRYSIVYYHCFTQSTEPFSFLNETFKKLPVYYYAMLEKIYVVQPSFIVKNTVGMFDFGRLHKLFSKRLCYVDNLYELGKIEQINASGILIDLPEILKHQKALKQQKKAKNSGALQNIENKNQTPQKQQLNSLTGPIILKSVQKIDYLTIPLQNHKLNSDGLPIALLILLQTLKSNSTFLNLEGIFRKSGSIQQEQQIISQLETMNVISTLKDIDQHSGYAVAGVVKKFFTKLTSPIIPFQVYNQIMTIQSIQQGQQVIFVKSIINKLPILNKRVLVHLLIFLKQQVIAKKQQNKMNNYNMSVCFCPCIFRARQASLEDLMNSGKYAKILDIIFSKFQEIFPKDQIKLFMGKQNRGSKGSKGSRGSRSSKQNRNSNKEDSPTRILI